MSRAASLALCVIVVSLCSCTREWHFTVTDLGDLTHPSLCVSERSVCRGSGISFSSFIVAEVDERGRYVLDGKLIQPMWIIEPVTDTPLKEVKYGQVPAGWRELQAAKPLEIGKFYSANGNHFFRIVQTNGHAVAEVLAHDEFLQRFYK